MKHASTSEAAPYLDRVASWMQRNTTLVICTVALLTVALAFPFILLPADERASSDPGGDVYEALARANTRFASNTTVIPFVVEARSGNLLSKPALTELFSYAEEVRTHPDIVPLLISYTDFAQDIDVIGLDTFADVIDRQLRVGGGDGLGSATELEVHTAVNTVLAARTPVDLGLSVHTTRDASGTWITPAAFVFTVADNNALGGGNQGVTLAAGDTRKEEFARTVQAVLRGEQKHIQVWGIAIDLNLTSEEQGQIAGPFIALTILAVLLVVDITFRSYWVIAITGAALAAAVIWLKGLSNLFGLKNDLILDLIVPIAMISFGIDFAVHAIGRYREEQRPGIPTRSAFTIGFGAVAAALLLALTTDSIAFLSNLSSGIESVMQFGVGAALGLIGSFLLLGAVTPLALSTVETRIAGRWISRRSRLVGRIAGWSACITVTASVLCSVFLLPWAGVAILGAYALLFLAVPYLLAGRGGTASSRIELPENPPQPSNLRLLGESVANLAKYWRVVLPTIIVITGLASVLALRVPTEFEPSDFLSPNTDFVIGLEKFEMHGGDTSGEPAIVYVETDLTSLASLTALDAFKTAAQGVGSQGLARDSTGHTRVNTGVLGIIDDVMRSATARDLILKNTGIRLTDTDFNGWPDTPEQLSALYKVTQRFGVPADSRQHLGRSPEEIQGSISLTGSEPLHATQLGFQVLGSSAQTNIAQVRADIEPLVEKLQIELKKTNVMSRAVLTGSPIVRQSSLDAISRALRISVPIAATLLLIVATVAMRSLPYGLVTIIPIGLVVIWLYAFMYVFGFAINIVTATIGAISIGIGVDFATHFTMRFREELRRHGLRHTALRVSGAGTGGALLASAGSSVVGFVILAFAPMPLFAAYGLLTAIMIGMALASSLVVLPSLLMLATKDQPQPNSTVSAFSTDHPRRSTKSPIS